MVIFANTNKNHEVICAKTTKSYLRFWSTCFLLKVENQSLSTGLERTISNNSNVNFADVGEVAHNMMDLSSFCYSRKANAANNKAWLLKNGTKDKS